MRQLLSASQNQEGRITVTVQPTPFFRKDIKKWASGGTRGHGMMETRDRLLWFDPQTTPWTQPQRLGREVLISAGPSSNQANTRRSSPSPTLTGSHYRRFHHDPSSAYLPTCPGTADFDQANMIMYLVLLSYSMSHHPPHQKLLNTHPRSSQKNICQKTQKGPIWCHRQSRERSRKVHRHQAVPFYSLRPASGLRHTQDICTAQTFLGKCFSSSQNCYCCSPAQKQEPIQLGI